MSNIVISIDHGYKHIKTEHDFFPTAISELKSMPDDKTGILKYNDRIYTEAGKQVENVDTQTKTDTDEFFLLTLISIAKEMNKMDIYNAEITLLGGLPQRWYDKQKEDFKSYLTNNGQNIFFEYEGNVYNIVIRKAVLFEQGYAAFFSLDNVDDYLTGEVCIVDIGGGTMDILLVKDGVLQKMDCKIDTHATIWLNNQIIEVIESELNAPISDTSIIKYITSGSLSTPTKNKYEEVMQRELKDYTKLVYTKLKQHKINTDLVPIIFVGGGAVIMKNFTENPGGTVEYVTDLRANANGYKKMYNLISS